MTILAYGILVFPVLLTLVIRYKVYLNYPRPSGRRVAIVEPPELAWEALLEEEPVQPNEVPHKQQTLNFHGLSRSGDVTGHLVYANYGSRDDFKELERRGANLTGSIVLVRYGGSQGDRALKVKAAELAGAAGCLIYSDPDEDGFKKGAVWPEGRWRPGDSVQRGAVSLMSWIVGDVLTPGYASTDEARRVSKDNNPGLVNIPSLPLAWRDAKKLLQSLKGHGEKVAEHWVGGVPDVDEWWTGGGQDSPLVNLKNEQDEMEKQPIWNVMGRIPGVEQPEKVIIVGNHRDAWCFGAGDPGSGTAILLEVVHIFGRLIELGWRPLRTIQFASWDGEEYNLIGSTEWVEHHAEALQQHAVAYLNIDAAVTGDKLRVRGSPMFARAVCRVLNRVTDPVNHNNLRAIWEDEGSKIEGLGAGSDYVAFQDIVGTASIDMSFDGPGFPYHSCYDNFEWMTKFGDPGFQYHKALAQVWALLILEMADRPFLPFTMEGYASQMESWMKDLESYAKSKASLVTEGDQEHETPSNSTLDLTPLKEAAQQFIDDAKEFESWSREWAKEVHSAGPDADSDREEEFSESTDMAFQRMSYNSRMANFDTHLLDLEPDGGVCIACPLILYNPTIPSTLFLSLLPI